MSHPERPRVVDRGRGPARRAPPAAALLIAALCGAELACAGSTTAARPDPVVLAERCDRGPFCVTGEIDDQFSAAVEAAKCIALREDGGSTTVLSDKRGVFFLDGLATAPRQVRFEKAGFNSQTVSVLASGPGAAARVYVIFHRIADSDCSCEPTAILAGHEPCPDERCGRSQFDVTIPESRPATP